MSYLVFVINVKNIVCVLLIFRSSFAGSTLSGELKLCEGLSVFCNGEMGK